MEVLESIFDGEGIVIKHPTIIQAADTEVKSTNSSGSQNDETELNNF